MEGAGSRKMAVGTQDGSHQDKDLKEVRELARQISRSVFQEEETGSAKI